MGTGHDGWLAHPCATGDLSIQIVPCGNLPSRLFKSRFGKCWPIAGVCTGGRAADRRAVSGVDSGRFTSRFRRYDGRVAQVAARQDFHACGRVGPAVRWRPTAAGRDPVRAYLAGAAGRRGTGCPAAERFASGEAMRLYSLVRPFDQIAPLRNRIGELVTIVLRLANMVAKADGSVTAAEAANLRNIQHELESEIVRIPIDEPSQQRGCSENGGPRGRTRAKYVADGADCPSQPCRQPLSRLGPSRRPKNSSRRQKRN